MATRLPQVRALEQLVETLEHDFATGCLQPGEGDSLRDGAVQKAREIEASLEPLRQRLLSLASRGLL